MNELPESTPVELRIYPLPQPADDPRFTFGFVLDVAEVLAGHGYPKITNAYDHLELQQALFRFLYKRSCRDDGLPETPVDTRRRAKDRRS